MGYFLLIKQVESNPRVKNAEKFMVFDSFDVAQEITLVDGYSVGALRKGIIKISLKLPPPKKNPAKMLSIGESICV